METCVEPIGSNPTDSRYLADALDAMDIDSIDLPGGFEESIRTVVREEVE